MAHSSFSSRDLKKINITILDVEGVPRTVEFYLSSEDHLFLVVLLPRAVCSTSKN